MKKIVSKQGSYVEKSCVFFFQAHSKSLASITSKFISIELKLESFIFKLMFMNLFINWGKKLHELGSSTKWNLK